MRTEFPADRLNTHRLSESNAILRSCVRCGMCSATCPSYQILGDELDSPRGRIYLIKNMLEQNVPADAKTVKHLDRCLGCYACMTTCPSGVHYRHLLENARAHIAKTFSRPMSQRFLRTILGTVLTRPKLLYYAMALAKRTQFAAPVFPQSIRLLFDQIPKTIEKPTNLKKNNVYSTTTKPVAWVALLAGCAQQTLRQQINLATIRLLNRLNVGVIIPGKAGCCGSLELHIGRENSAVAKAKRNIRALIRENQLRNIDAFVINTSGCGTTVKDYGHMLKDDVSFAQDASYVADLACDVTELIDRFRSEISALAKANASRISIASDVESGAARAIRVAYHSACSLQHGQGIRQLPQDLLRLVGFEVVEPTESHLCCGSAGVYSILEPDIANQLRDRKNRNLRQTKPDIIASGNMPCLDHIQRGIGVPCLHTVELIDWACGGPTPESIAHLSNETSHYKS